MQHFDQITFDPGFMGGKPCIRGMRVTVGMVLGQLAAGHGAAERLDAYPYLEHEDILVALSYAALRAQETKLPLKASCGCCWT